MYAFQELLIENLEGEAWKDVPGLEGHYKVSNLGRVKSLDRTVPHKRYGTQFIKGRMLRQKTVKDFNSLTGDEMVSLRIALTLEGTMYFSIPGGLFTPHSKSGLITLKMDCI